MSKGATPPSAYREWASSRPRARVSRVGEASGEDGLLSKRDLDLSESSVAPENKIDLDINLNINFIDMQIE
jgi:hypothetical protein